MKNHIHVIGPIGNKAVFLNLTREDALQRWLDAGNTDGDLADNYATIKVIYFDDEFAAYDCWSL